MKIIHLFLILFLFAISFVSFNCMSEKKEIDFRLDMYKHLFLTSEFQKASRRVRIQAMKKIIAQEYTNWLRSIELSDLIHTQMKKLLGNSIYSTPDYTSVDHSARALLFSQRAMVAVINKECETPCILSEPTQAEYKRNLLLLKGRRGSEQTNLAIEFLFEFQNNIQKIEDRYPREKHDISCSLM